MRMSLAEGSAVVIAVAGIVAVLACAAINITHHIEAATQTRIAHVTGR